MFILQEPQEKNADDEQNFGLEILSQLFVSGNYEGIIDLILQHLTGVELTALQLAHPVLAQFIEVRGEGRVVARCS